jgi:hypothetical protein
VLRDQRGLIGRALKTLHGTRPDALLHRVCGADEIQQAPTVRIDERRRIDLDPAVVVVFNSGKDVRAPR